MKRLFLLIAVCMIGMVNALAGITVVPPDPSSDNSYVLTVTSPMSTDDWQNLPSYVKEAESVTIKTDNYPLTTIDIYEIMGGEINNQFQDPVFSNLKSLDMGDAVLVNNEDLAEMKITKQGKGLTQLTSFTFPKTVSEIPAEMFSGNTTIKEIIMLEGNLTAITEQAFQGCTSLSNVRIPDGVTVIGPNAFEHCAFEAISLPNTLTTISSNAFGYCENLKTITIPASVTFIGPSCFQQNKSLTDVYIIGDNVQIGDQAFDHNLTQNKFEYNGSLDGDPNTVTIEDWKSQNDENYGQIPLRLHIPNTQTALERYMNPNLRFLNSMNDPEMVKRALGELGEPTSDENVQKFIDNIAKYYSERWFDSMDSHTDAYLTRNVINQLKSLCNANQIYSNDDVMPNNWETMEGWRYFHTASGKFNFGPGQSTSPYAGWWNFMFVAGDIEEKTWPDGRMVDSRWYSAVFPFDMSYNQLMSAYGAKTDVREFTGVKSEVDGSKTKLTVTFNQRVPEPSNHEDRYIVKGHPYMIHPGVRSYNSEGQSAPRYIAGISKEEAEKVIGNIAGIAAEETEKVTVGEYTFQGTYQDDYLPQYCYYLGMYPNDLSSLKFYYTKTAGTTNKNWKQFTSIVMVSESLGANGAKSMDMDFSIFNQNVFNDNYGIATSIEKAQTERELSDRIYNLNGQVIGKGSLQSMPKGIYVVNGKKIVVR